MCKNHKKAQNIKYASSKQIKITQLSSQITLKFILIQSNYVIHMTLFFFNRTNNTETDC